MGNPEHDASDADMTAYLDDQLDGEAAQAFESHLADSPDARAELADLRQVVQLVSALPRVSAPQDFYEKVRRKLRRHKLLSRDRVVISLISWPFQVLSILVILTIAALYMMAHLDEQPTGALQRDTVRPAPPGESIAPDR